MLYTELMFIRATVELGTVVRMPVIWISFFSSWLIEEDICMRSYEPLLTHINLFTTYSGAKVFVLK